MSTFNPPIGSGGGGSYVVGDKFGAQSAEKIRQAFDVLIGRRAVYPLGGSRNVALQHNAVIDAYDYLDIEIDGTDLAGLTAQARVEVRVENAGLSVTPSIRNVTDSTDAGTGLACVATSDVYSGTNQKQTIALTLASGVKKYRLRFTPTNNTYMFWGLGTIEIFL